MDYLKETVRVDIGDPPGVAVGTVKEYVGLSEKETAKLLYVRLNKDRTNLNYLNIHECTEYAKEIREGQLKEYLPRNKMFITEAALTYLSEVTFSSIKDRFNNMSSIVRAKYHLTKKQLIDIQGLQEQQGDESKKLGIPLNSIPIKLPEDIEISGHAMNMINSREMKQKLARRMGRDNPDEIKPVELAQYIIDTSMFMFNQKSKLSNKIDGKTRLYVSSDGATAISVSENTEGTIVTIFHVSEFDKYHLGVIVRRVETWLGIK